MTDAFHDTSEWVCGISKNKVQQGFLLAGFMVVSGLVLMFVLNTASPDAAIIGMINIAFGLIVYFMSRRSALNSSRLLVLNEEGVWYRDWKGPVVPWDQIANIELGDSRIKAAIRITLKNPDTVVTMLDASNRAAFEKNQLVNMPIIKIPNGSLAAPLEQIREKMIEFAKRARPSS